MTNTTQAKPTHLDTVTGGQVTVTQTGPRMCVQDEQGHHDKFSRSEFEARFEKQEEEKDVNGNN